MVLTRMPATARALAAMSLLMGVASVSCAPKRLNTGAVPPLVLVDTAGATTRYPEDLARAKLTVVMFYSDQCPCFRIHEERIREMAQTYGPKGVQLLLVDSEVAATQERDARAVAERHLPAVALDRGATLADALGAEYATYALVFDGEGRLRYRGGIDSDKTVLHPDSTRFVADALDDLLAGREPRVTEGKTLGCALQKH
jgi:hypothetical protein